MSSCTHLALAYVLMHAPVTRLYPHAHVLATRLCPHVRPSLLQTRLASGWLNLPLPIVIATERGTRIVLNTLLTAIIEPFHP